MTGRFEFAASLFRGAETPEKRRAAARVWLTDAIQRAMSEGDDAAPALALLGALEGLDFGHVDPMLKLPAGRARGGKEAPPAETGLMALALAAIDRLVTIGMDVSSAIYLVAEELGLEVGALTSKRKHVLSERAKSKPTKYRELIRDFEEECERLRDQSKDEVIFGLVRVSQTFGLNSSLDPIP
ncbi:hypothetical protein NP284_40085 [Rhodopseudomonas pseudopalustris]|uniref:hypothetical protein n=1 Tax=Rhodopseudomonas pseudopalustris TaxID=1513892 RepID=UPI003F9E97A8